MNKKILLLSVALAMSLGSLSSAGAATTAALYGGGKFYNLTSTDIDGLRNSGFTTMFLFTIHIRANGDFYFNDTLVAQNGQYVGDSAWRSRLDACRERPSRIERIEMCIGSWGSTSFDAIRDRIAADGTGSSTILYRNMLALKNALGFEAVQFDDELTYDASSMVAFGNMLSNMGLKVTLCPYTYSSFWQNVASQLGSKVDAIYLQCYDGGAGNNPSSWSSLFGRKVIPGYWWRDGGGGSAGLAAFTAKMKGWKASAAAEGGFLWTDDAIPAGEMAGYAASIIDSVTTVTFYKDINYGGTAVSLTPGKYTLSQLQSAGISNDDISSARVPSGLSVVLYKDNNFGGTSWTLTGDNSDFRNLSANDEASSCIVTLATGTYKVMSRISGLALDATGLGTANGTLLQQWEYTGSGGSNQKWTVSHLGDGKYRLIGQGSGRAVDVPSSSLDDSVQLQLHDWNNTGAQKWTFNYVGSGYFELVNETSGKAMDVRSSSTANGAAVQQYHQNSTSAQQWIFLAP